MKKVHLIVYVHGLSGNRGDSRYLSEQLLEKFTSIETYISTVNEGWLMNDGIDACGIRLAQEIYTHIVELRLSQSITITHFSIFGHSMGGLLARFAVGVLDRQQVFKNIKLMNFITFASPHLGVCFPQTTWYGQAANSLMGKAGCPTTDHLSMVDVFKDGKPLLEVLSNPDYEFYVALSKFKNKRSYANTVGDFSVAYCTSALELSNHFDDDSNMEILCDLEYPSIIKHYDIKEVRPFSPKTTVKAFLFTAFLCFFVPVYFVWPKTKHWDAHNETVTKYTDQSNNFCVHIDLEKHAFLFEDIPKQKEEGLQQTMKEKPGCEQLFNPKFGPKIEDKKAYQMGFPPVQQRISQNLNSLYWERVLVRIDSVKSHVLIMGMVENAIEGRDVVKHFVDTFDY
ncbi:putative serine esterase-domain-containing protein [Sporodiniella umbellata]|nr:putative serine esterase-domain-containing protein [Sporodiniella umbellata]